MTGDTEISTEHTIDLSTGMCLCGWSSNGAHGDALLRVWQQHGAEVWPSSVYASGSPGPTPPTVPTVWRADHLADHLTGREQVAADIADGEVSAARYEAPSLADTPVYAAAVAGLPPSDAGTPIYGQQVMEAVS